MPSTSLVDFVAGLRQRLGVFGRLPESLQEGSWIPGTGFFPGGDGYFKPRLSNELPDVMVIGRDFGTIDYLESCINAGSESETQATWLGVLKRLNAAGLQRERCFFTNLFVGFRAKGRNDDAMPIHRDQAFITRCAEFLRFEIKALRPRAIVTLGTAVPSIIGGFSADLSKWRTAKTFKELDEVGPIFFDAMFSEGHRANVCALVHPSKAWLNVGRRRFVDRSGFLSVGESAEVAMLREATLF